MLDINLGIEDGANKIFLTMYDQKIYISVGGLAFNDIIYSSDFIDARPENDRKFSLEFDSSYSKPDGMKVNHYTIEHTVIEPLRD